MKSSEEREHNLQKLKNRSKKKVSVDSDSGYCSMMESGYSSNRDSASQSFIVYYFFIIFFDLLIRSKPFLGLGRGFRCKRENLVNVSSRDFASQNR